MMLQGLALSLSAIVVLVAVGGFVPLPEAMQDRLRATLFLGFYKITHILPFKISARLGFGNFFENLITLQNFMKDDVSNPPKTSTEGGLEVSRDEIEGVPIIIYKPKGSSTTGLLPGLVYIHGGGWVTHYPNMYDRFVYDIASCCGKITISVNYRLAPKHPFPAAVEDCMAVTKYVLQHGKKFGIDVDRVGIAGDSAGGNLAPVVALQLNEAKRIKLPPLKFQALLCPALQAINLKLPSYLEEATPFPSRRRMAGFWAVYLGLDPAKSEEFIDHMVNNEHVSPALSREVSEYLDIKRLPVGGNDKHRPEASQVPSFNASLFASIQEHITSPLLSPLIAPDLRGMPPTLLVLSQYDVLRDEGLMLAARLRGAGVRTQVHLGNGYHGDYLKIFPDFLHSKTGEKSFQVLCDFLQNEG